VISFIVSEFPGPYNITMYLINKQMIFGLFITVFQFNKYWFHKIIAKDELQYKRLRRDDQAKIYPILRVGPD